MKGWTQIFIPVEVNVLSLKAEGVNIDTENMGGVRASFLEGPGPNCSHPSLFLPFFCADLILRQPFLCVAAEMLMGFGFSSLQ